MCSTPLTQKHITGHHSGSIPSIYESWGLTTIYVTEIFRGTSVSGLINLQNLFFLQNNANGIQISDDM
jgi:hypothetical protein